jgi:two-component system, LytTR family, sensor kinase
MPTSITTVRSFRPKSWVIVSAIWLWPAVFNVIRQLVGHRLLDWSEPTVPQLLFEFGDWLGYALFTPAIFWIAERWPVTRETLGARTALHFLFALLFCVLWAVGGKLLQLLVYSVLERERIEAAIVAAGGSLAVSVATNVVAWIITTIPWGVIVYATTAAMAHAISYFGEATNREIQLARANEQLATARFDALQAQVNPHFMFNTLNTVAVLVRENDRDGAVRIVEQLSDVLRRTLSREQRAESRLDEELTLVRHYLSIEETRFSDRLRAVFTIAPGLAAAAIPRFAVQHLVENAIRHGIARRTEASTVHVMARRDDTQLVVSVIDDGPGIERNGRETRARPREHA